MIVSASYDIRLDFVPSLHQWMKSETIWDCQNKWISTIASVELQENGNIVHSRYVHMYVFYTNSFLLVLICSR
jgi:hypothetical protein